MDTLRRNVKLLCTTVVFLTMASRGMAQATIVNYDFNTGSSYGTLSPATATNITSSASSTEAWQTYTGITSGSNAFTANTTAGNGIAMVNSSGTNTRYFQFQLSGSGLSTYAAYKVYFQAQRSSTGAGTVTLAYSTNGTSYTSFPGTQSPGNGSYNECQFDLSAVSSLSMQPTVYFRVLASGASGTGTLRIDNFQVKATQVSCSSPVKLFYTAQPVSTTQGSVFAPFSIATTCSTNIVATGCNSGSITLAFSGTGASGTLVRPVVNGVASFTDISVAQAGQYGVSFTAAYSGACGTFSAASSNTLNVTGLKDENFDGSPGPWSYTVGTPTATGSGGASGSDVTGLKNFGAPNNNALSKSYSADNASGEKGTLNTITFSNVSGLNAYGHVKFSFQIGSLGSGSGAGTDNGEYMLIETSLDGGATWNGLLKNNGYNDHAFGLSPASPVTLAYNANSVYSNGDALWSQSAFAVNLPAGTSQFRFRITASDNRTAENWVIDNIRLEAVPKLMASASVQDYTSDSLQGSVSLLISGGTPPYNIAWNGNKIPSATEAYHDLLGAMPGLVTDSVVFKHDIDSLKQRTYFTGLAADHYPVTVYDQNNDSVVMNASVATKTTDFFANGATLSTCAIPSRVMNGLTYYYGIGECMAQSGTFVPNNHFDFLLDPVYLDQVGGISFIMPSASDVAYVGLRGNSDTTVNGFSDDMGAITMFRFNGNGTYDILFNSGVLTSGPVAANDQFAIRANATSGMISYYKNEVLLAQTAYAPINTDINGLLAKVVLGSPGARVAALQLTRFSLTPRVTGQITDATCDNACGGSITAAGYYPIASVGERYDLYNASSVLVNSISVASSPMNSATFNGLCAGKYTVKYYYRIRTLSFPGTVHLSAVTGPVTQVFEIAYKPNWVARPNVTVSLADNSLTKTGGVTGSWDAGTSSVNSLKQTDSGWMEWTAPATDAVNGTGFGPATYAGTNITGIDYGVGVARLSFWGMKLYVMTHNNTMINSVIFTANARGNFADNDVFRLEKNYAAGTVSLSVNSAFIGSFTGLTFTDYVMYGDLQTLGGTIRHPRVSFDCCSNCSPQQHAKLAKKLDGSFYYLRSNGELLFKLDGEYSAGNLHFTVQDKYNHSVATNATAGIISSTSVIPGDNRYRLDFSNAAYPVGYYILKVTNEKNEAVYLRFKK